MKFVTSSPEEGKDLDSLVKEASDIVSNREQADSLFKDIKGIKPWHIRAFRLIQSGNYKTAKAVANAVGVSVQSVRNGLADGGILKKMVSRAETDSLVAEARTENFRKLSEMSALAITNIDDFNHTDNDAIRFKNSWNIIKEVNGTSVPQVTTNNNNISVKQNIQLNLVEKVNIIKNRLKALAAAQADAEEAEVVGEGG